MSICRRCDAEAAVGARFCSRCGETLDRQGGPAIDAEPAQAPAAIRATSGHATAEMTGRSCPYCRFPLKEGGAMRICETCGAPHHLDCWTDNGGCAVLGCVGGPDGRPSTGAGSAVHANTQARRQPDGHRDHEPVQRHRPRSVPLGAAALAVAVVALAGVAATILAGGPSGHHADGQAHESGHGTAASGGAAAVSAHVPSSTTTETTATRSTPTGLTLDQKHAFSVEVPSGWVQEDNEVVKPAEVENTWHRPGASEPSVLIDVHAPTHLTPQQDAEPVHQSLEEASGYRQIYYGEGDLSSHAAWMWIFEHEGSERIDYFFETCSNVIAVLGAASPESFGTLRSTFHDVAQSVRSDCE